MFWIVRIRRWRETAYRRGVVSDVDNSSDRREREGVHVRIQNRVIIYKLPEYQLRVRLEGRVEREEDLAVLLNGQVLDKVQPIWAITVGQMPRVQ